MKYMDTKHGYLGNEGKIPGDLNGDKEIGRHTGIKGVILSASIYYQIGLE